MSNEPEGAAPAGLPPAPPASRQDAARPQPRRPVGGRLPLFGVRPCVNAALQQERRRVQAAGAARIQEGRFDLFGIRLRALTEIASQRVKFAQCGGAFHIKRSAQVGEEAIHEVLVHLGCARRQVGSGAWHGGLEIEHSAQRGG